MPKTSILARPITRIKSTVTGQKLLRTRIAQRYIKVFYSCYRVGATSSVSVGQRKELLTKCLQGELRFSSDSDGQYISNGDEAAVAAAVSNRSAHRLPHKPQSWKKLQETSISKGVDWRSQVV